MNLSDSKKGFAVARYARSCYRCGAGIFGNPRANMAFCIACFIRDTAGALGMHSADCTVREVTTSFRCIFNFCYHKGCIFPSAGFITK